MFTASPERIDKYSKCPQRAKLEWNLVQDPLSPESEVVRNVIKRSYIYFLEKEKPVPWKTLIRWTEHQLASNLPEAETREAKYKNAKGTLHKISTWYENHYIKDLAPGLINLPINLKIGSRFTFQDNIEIVSISDRIKLFEFKEVDDKKKDSRYNRLRIHNSMLTYARIWGFWKSTETLPSEYVRITVRSQSIQTTRIQVIESVVKRIGHNIEQIITGIKSNAFYPSFSEQCNLCSVKSSCKI